MDAREWADRGCRDVREEIRDLVFPLDDRTAGRAIRAAYIAGYLAALTQEDPLSRSDASEAQIELALRLPVS